MIENLVCANETGVTERAHAYTLTKVDLPTDYTIVKQEIDLETGNLVPTYYRIDLNKTQYGSGSNTKNYSVMGQDITVNYNNANIGAIVSDFVDNRVSSNNIHGGLIYNNSNRTIGELTGVFAANTFETTRSVDAVCIYNLGTLENRLSQIQTYNLIFQTNQWNQNQK